MKNKKAKAAPKAKASKPPSLQPEEIPWEKLSRLREFQMRVDLDDSHVSDMCEAIRERKKLPRVKVYRLKDGRLVVVDGFHRCEAYLRMRIAVVPCLVMPGTYFEAFCAASAANKEHQALKRSNADKRRAVECFLAALAKEGQAWTNKRVAEHVGVSPDLVDRIVRATPDSGVARVAADGRVFTAREGATPESGVAPPKKYALPSGIRDLALGKDVPCPDPVRKQLAAEGIKSAGDFYARYKAKDLCGLEQKQAELIGYEVQKRYVQAAVDAAEHADPRRLLAATYKRWVAAFSPDCINKSQAWWIANKKTGTKPFFMTGAAPTEDEAAAYYTVLIANEQTIRGIKEGESIVEALAEPGGAIETVSIAPPKALDKTPPTLTNGRVDSKPKGTGWPSAELVITALKRRQAERSASEATLDGRLAKKLVNVKDFPPQVAGNLSMRGVRTVRELLESDPCKSHPNDPTLGIPRVITDAGHTAEAARCVAAVRTWLQKAG